MIINKELLFTVSIKDCKVQTFCSGGEGGQNQNKTNSGVRISHPFSKAVGECRETRDQKENKKRAWIKLVNTKEFKMWHRIETGRRMGEPSIEEKVKEMLKPENLKVEYWNVDKKEWKNV